MNIILFGLILPVSGEDNSQKWDKGRIDPLKRKYSFSKGKFSGLHPSEMIELKYLNEISGMGIVEGGSYQRGYKNPEIRKTLGISKKSELQCFAIDGEDPIHPVWIDTFYVDKTEVTNSQFCEFLNIRRVHKHGGKRFLRTFKRNSLIVYQEGKWIPRKGYEEFPVTDVNWFGAREYADFKGKRLPTEAEWEYLASKSFLSRITGNVHKVATDQPDSLGLYDIRGNVSEWMEDDYDFSTYSHSKENNPLQKKWKKGRMKVIRGEASNSSPNDQEIYRRKAMNPYFRSEWVGFRCVKTIHPDDMKIHKYVNDYKSRATLLRGSKQPVEISK